MLSVEICYAFKYAEFKQARQSWVIRQTGVYHQYRASTKQSIWIIINPLQASLAELRIRDLVQTPWNRINITQNHLLLHPFLLSIYFSNWTDYCEYYESTLEKMASS
jgi:hypothetical protein